MQGISIQKLLWYNTLVNSAKLNDGFKQGEDAERRKPEDGKLNKLISFQTDWRVERLNYIRTECQESIFFPKSPNKNFGIISQTGTVCHTKSKMEASKRGLFSQGIKFE